VSRPPSGGPVPEAAPPRGVEIRPARPRDARGILALRRTLAAEERFIRTEHVRESVRDTRRRARRSWRRDEASIVAIHDGSVIGHLGVGREDHPVTAHVASLGMGVSPEWRGRGVGAALLAEAFRWARWAGIEKVGLTVYPGNDRARALYERFGFVTEGRLTGHSKKSYGYDDEIVMGRWL
jgi:putative acetyltransferase